MSTHADGPAAAVEVVDGLLMLLRALGLWRLQRLTWLVMVVLPVIDAATAVGELLLGTRTATIWLSLFVAAGTALYLLTPNLRELFAKAHASQ